MFIYLSRGVRAPIVYLKRVCSLGQACVFILSHQVFLNLPLKLSGVENKSGVGGYVQMCKRR